MKVTASYSRITQGVKVCIRVENCVGHFTTSLFYSKNDYPTDNTFVIKGVEALTHYSSSDYIEKKFAEESWAEAEQWARDQVKALKEHLDAFRARKLPEDATFEI